MEQGVGAAQALLLLLPAPSAGQALTHIGAVVPLGLGRCPRQCPPSRLGAALRTHPLLPLPLPPRLRPQLPSLLLLLLVRWHKLVARLRLARAGRGCRRSCCPCLPPCAAATTPALPRCFVLG